MNGRIFLGTAGWNVPREHAARFPAEGSHLERYAARFPFVEVNSTFYRRHRRATFERWARVTPVDFRFAVKLARTLTHEQALARPARVLDEFFDDVSGLGSKLGPVLVQLPASQPFVAARLRAFLRALRARFAGPVAIEPRNAGFYGSSATALLEEFDVARVVADPPRPAAATEPAGARRLVYARLHGTPRVYWSSYADRIDGLARALRGWSAGAQVFCVFDNTASGAAAGDACLVAAALTSEAARP